MSGALDDEVYAVVVHQRIYTLNRNVICLVSIGEPITFNITLPFVTKLSLEQRERFQRDIDQSVAPVLVRYFSRTLTVRRCLLRGAL